jgi:cobalt-zinc-cadmium resistance protein CzcA
MLESVLRFSIRSRYLVIILTLLAAAVGVFAAGRLPIDAVPDITNNQVQINTELSSLGPVEIEKQVTFPIETSLAGIPGLENTRSLSRNGFSQVTAVFKDKVDIYFARQQVLERLQEARELLPAGAEPKMGAISTGLGEVTMWTVEFEHPNGEGATVRDGELGWQKDGSYLTPEGEKLVEPWQRASYLRTVQDWIIRPQLKGVEGIAGVDAIGGYTKQYQVSPDLSKMTAYGVTFHEIVEALEKNNVSAGSGFVENNGESYLLKVDGRVETAAQLEDIYVTMRKGVPIRIRDVAQVGPGREARTGSASEGGEEAVVGTALMLIGENSRTVAKAVEAKLETIRKSLPSDILAEVRLNRTTLVDATIDTVKKNLIEGAIFVIVVLFVMLGNIRAALITAAAIPITMLLTMTGMVQARISGNLMSLGAIDFGLIIDGAVIIVENCLRRIAEKQHELGRNLTLSERLEVVFSASKQVRKATAFGEAIIIAVYIPILGLTGVEGKMFHPMAATVIFALIAAFVLSLTFVPAMVALCITGKVTEKDNLIVRVAKKAYTPVLDFSLANRGAVVAAAVLVFVASGFLFSRLGQEFIPTLDEKNIAFHAMRIPSTSLTQSTQMQLDVEKRVAAFPEVEHVFSKTGTAEMASDPMPPNVSDTFVILKAQEKWPNPKESKQEFIGRLEADISTILGNAYEFSQPIQMRFNELIAGVRSDVAVKVYGDDFESMEQTAGRIVASLSKVPGATAVRAEQTKGLPSLNIEVDRDAIARHGLSVSAVQDAIEVAVGGKEAGFVFQGDRRFEVFLRLDSAQGSPDLAALERLPIPVGSSEGEAGQAAYVPLSELARIAVNEGPNQVSRENGKRRIVVQANVRGTDLGSFVTEAQRRIDAEVKLPAGQWLEWGGQFENLLSARERLAIVVPLCFLLILGMLYKAFSSFKDALLVFCCVPLAMTGGVVSLWLRGMPFSISAAVGFIALSGVAVLNGLVMVSFIKELLSEGKPLEEAIREGSMTRLRPVLMTALVAAFGFIPMMLNSGTGAEVQRPLATVVVGGIISSTLLTLIVLPALYRLFIRDPKTRSQSVATESLASPQSITFST